MRWFIVFLIVANVILFFWVQQQSRPLPGAAALPPPDVGRLRLLSEVNEEQALVDSNEREPVYPEELAVEPPVSAASDDQSIPADAEDSLQSSVDIGVDLEMNETSWPLTQAEDQPVVTPVQEAAVEPVVQETDAAVAQAGPEDPGAAAIAEPPVVAAVQAVCARVGPFDSENADKLISGLPAYIALLSEIAEEYASVDRYYVLIPSLPSRVAGYEKLKELADAGVTDTWLFPSGEYRNAISLGFFSREAGAKRHAASIARKGFATEIKAKTSVRERRWLLLKSTDGGDLGSSLPLPAGVSAEQQACP